MSLDKGIGVRGAMIIFIVVATADVAWWVPAMLLTGPYYRSLSYEIRDDEVIVHAGIWTKSVKHVPYRTVTNLTVKRDILDRWLGVGTLNIQTAGMSGTTGAEESLVGLADVQGVYESVVTKLRRFRGGMAPTAAETEGEPAMVPTDALSAILTEVRAIRRALEKRE
ncbi:MAG TPA: PH domain-containing protein [Anaerolineae bacterium]|nr:PH domain-containing protein [Anaerolineae bacterium]